jgi:hypothetical protein
MEGPDRRVHVDGLDLGRLIPAARVPGAVFTAMRPERLMVGVLVILFLVAIGRSWDAATEGQITLQLIGLDGETEAVAVGDFEATRLATHAALGTIITGLIGFDVPMAGRGVVALFYGVPDLIWSNARPFLVLYGLVCAFVFGIAGAAIARLEAERFGKDRDVTIGAAIGWAAHHWQRLVGAVLLPPVLALVVLVVPLVFGMAALVPGLDVVAAVFWGVALFFGLAAALILIAWMVSLPYLVPAAACEDADPGEVVVRAAGLAWRKPFGLISLALVAIISGVLGWFLVSGLAVITLDASRAAGSVFGAAAIEALPSTTWPGLEDVASVPAGEPLEGTRWLAFAITDLWRTFVLALAYGWVVSYALCAGTRIYLLQRASVEGLEVAELGEPGPEG